LSATSGNIFKTGVVNVNEVDEEAPIESEGLGRLLIPGAVIAAIVGAVIFFITSGRNEPQKAASAPSEVAKETRGQQRRMIEIAPASITAPENFKTISAGLTDIIDELLTNLNGVKDSESAERAVPGIKAIVTKIDTLAPGLKTLSSSERSKIDELLLEQMKKLNPLIDQINAMPEIGNTIPPLLEQARKILARYAN
jgi:hypothetical protein